MLIVAIILAVLFAMLGSFVYGMWCMMSLLERYRYINPYKIASDCGEKLERRIRIFNRKLRRKSIMF